VLSSIIEVNGMRAQMRDARNLTWRYGVEYHKKFALPLASFCFVLLGVSLALKYPRSGIGLVIGGSLVVFLVFYVLLIGGENLADKGKVPPVVAMYAPVLLFTLAGLVGVVFANREIGTGRSAGIVEAIADLFRRRGGGSA
jgi:lipopolysaccharide export system permease protein